MKIRFLSFVACKHWCGEKPVSKRLSNILISDIRDWTRIRDYDTTDHAVEGKQHSYSHVSPLLHVVQRLWIN